MSGWKELKSKILFDRLFLLSFSAALTKGHRTNDIRQCRNFRWGGSGEVSGNIIHSWVTVFTCQWRTGRIQFEWILLKFLRDKHWKDTNQNAFAPVMRWVLICYVFLCLNPFFNRHWNTKVSRLCWENHSAQVWHLFFLWIKIHWRVL